MAGNRGVVKKRGFTLALLNENSVLKSMLIVSHMGISFLKRRAMASVA